jgi:acyl-coenzyme A thioesterase PaaI-like protein
MAESLRTRAFRHAFNVWPCFLGTGGRVTYIAADWREVRVRLPMSLQTRNYVGSIYGGSMYGAVDPFYMLMLMKNLGPGYVVWDKAATIRFRRPGRSTLHARFTLDQEEIDAVREAAGRERSVDRTYAVDLVDGAGEVHASVEKLIYVRERREGEAG